MQQGDVDRASHGRRSGSGHPGKSIERPGHYHLHGRRRRHHRRPWPGILLLSLPRLLVLVLLRAGPWALRIALGGHREGGTHRDAPERRGGLCRCSPPRQPLRCGLRGGRPVGGWAWRDPRERRRPGPRQPPKGAAEVRGTRQGIAAGPVARRRRGGLGGSSEAHTTTEAGARVCVLLPPCFVFVCGAAAATLLSPGPQLGAARGNEPLRKKRRNGGGEKGG